ncbi:hypothetical protein F2P81_017990 [Scophthalmus maximus]|uniref:Uncharacterized protein n=1 Tax=Scophthalmus maximus TaxID=52904 RepID=A0A6A4S986_SCOMX|nr:hypothetical protein F2P81_017990 [Scophthalmus maximus]
MDLYFVSVIQFVAEEQQTHRGVVTWQRRTPSREEGREDECGCDVTVCMFTSYSPRSPPGTAAAAFEYTAGQDMEARPPLKASLPVCAASVLHTRASSRESDSDCPPRGTERNRVRLRLSAERDREEPSQTPTVRREEPSQTPTVRREEPLVREICRRAAEEATENRGRNSTTTSR